jgi:S-adenosylmethionine synthetase
MEVILQKLVEKPIEQTPVEIVERKGKGHPDSLCDGAADQLSIELSKYYVKHFGQIMHHNVDKCVLVGGASRADFGGGEILTPIHFIMVGLDMAFDIEEAIDFAFGIFGSDPADDDFR